MQEVKRKNDELNEKLNEQFSALQSSKSAADRLQQEMEQIKVSQRCDMLSAPLNGNCCSSWTLQLNFLSPLSFCPRLRLKRSAVD